MDQAELQKAGTPNTLPEMDHLWMPFTANRQFKAAPRLLVGAKDMYYRTHDGREILDGTAGLWCVNAGHGRALINAAIARQTQELDYAPPFQMGHPVQFEAANMLAAIAPADLKKVFFTNSGSESVDTALKIALAYHRARGEASRTVLIGRERGYHGVGFGGISVGGMTPNRKVFHGNLLPNVDHLPHTYGPEQAFSRGQPTWGAHLADELERLVALHDASNIAAVIVEPVAGSTGVLVPPKGYLEKLRAICDKHGILLIFDEVITGYGRLGTPFAAQYFGVTPDIITTAKAVNNAAVPMGAVFVRNGIYDTVVNSSGEGAVEFFHGYTYSGHPLATAATVATQTIYREEGLLTRAQDEGLAQYWEDTMHATLRDATHVKDLRNLGLIAGIELESRPGAVGKRAFEAFLGCYERGCLIRYTGDTLAMSPPLIINRAQIDQLFGTIRETLKTIA